MKKIFLLIIFFNFFYNCYAYSIESYVVLKINNKIVTNVDIDNEYRYLIALSSELQNVGKETVMEIARNSIIREKIKEEELMKLRKEKAYGEEEEFHKGLEAFKKDF